MPPRISDSTVRRLSHYLRGLEEAERRGVPTVSSQDMAVWGGTTAAQVRKDLSQFGSFGKRGMGYAVPRLAQRLREIMGLDHPWKIALVGAGRIGSALHAYPRFRERGFQCMAVLDSDPEKIGQHWGSTVVEDVADLERIIREREVRMVILAVPASAAQEVADRAVSAGARGILNFAPTRLRVPPEVSVANVNLVIEMEALSFDLTRKARGG
ncbi:MAG: redox-sensing transcriptional repressor Rex [Gemmatimonadota bacterium]